MARAGRVVLGSLGLGLLIVLLNGLHLAGSQTAGASGAKAETLDAGSGAQEKREAAAVPDAASDVARFFSLLGQLRRNDETVVPEMRDLAERLCTTSGRCDLRDILAYCLQLAPEERLRGAVESAKGDDVWGAIWQGLQTGAAGPDWDRFRDVAVEQLRDVANQSSAAADVIPAATALSGLSFIETDRLQRDPRLTEAERAQLLATARLDAQRALESFAKCGMVAPRIQPMYLLAYLHCEAGEDREANVAFQECLAFARGVRQVFWQEKCFEGLLRLARRAGDLRERAELLDELALVRSPRESWVLASANALLLLDQDLGASAAEFLEVNRPLNPAESREMREWNVLRGSAYLRVGDLQSARDAFASAEPPPWGPDIRLGMALVDIRASNAERALEQLSRPEFMEDPHPVTRAYALELRGEALVRLKRYDEAVETLGTALDIAGRLQSRFERDRELIDAATSVIGEGVGVYAVALLAEAQVRAGHDLDAARSIENWQSRTLRRNFGSNEDLLAADLVRWAQFAGAGLVTWVVGAESSVVVFVAPDGTASGAPISRGRRAIEAAVRRLNDAVRSNDRAQSERLAREVSAGVLPPAIAKRIDEVEAAGSGRVLFLVHGPLERLPIEFLFRDAPIVPLILPGLPEAKPGASVTADDLSTWVLLGNPVDSDGRALLPGAREELAAVASLRGASVTSPTLRDVQAASLDGANVQVRAAGAFDRKSLNAALEGHLPIHVATHLVHGCGRKQGRIADVGLELSSDSSFCAREILDSKPRLPLAVLDACETAEGRFVDAEGLQGVARAFLESGTRNLLVTLWPVEDQAARSFAEEFHRELIAGRPPSEAAATARAHLRARGFPPADWAAFRFVGRD